MNRLRLLVVAATFAFSSVVAAQEAPAPEDRAASFQAVEGASRDQVSGFGLMVGAYGLVWLLTTAFLFRLGRLQAKTAADVARLEALLAEDAKKG